MLINLPHVNIGSIVSTVESKLHDALPGGLSHSLEAAIEHLIDDLGIDEDLIKSLSAAKNRVYSVGRSFREQAPMGAQQSR